VPTDTRVTSLRTIEWVGGLDGAILMVDQTRLPEVFTRLECKDVGSVHDAIRRLVVRGAPAIGIAAAMGVVIGVRDADDGDEAAFFEKLDATCDYIASSRPTAVNLFWALDRMKRVASAHRGRGTQRIKETLLAEAKAIRDEDAAMCRAIGEHGQSIIPEGAGVLTHCNAGALATAEYGTALAVMYVAHDRGRRFSVYADETRPLLQGARLTAWELGMHGIDVTLICDNMAAQVMKEGRVQLVITGADRIAGNGDVANKVGTYGVAVLCKAHKVPFFVAAPLSTIDQKLRTGAEIPIEQRDPSEVTHLMGKRVAPHGVQVYNPAFDVTPARYVSAIVTEKGVLKPPYPGAIRKLFR